MFWKNTFWYILDHLISMTFFQFFLPKNGWEDHPFFFPFFPKLQEFLFLPSMSFGSKRPPTVPNPAPWSSRAKDHQLSPPGSRAVAFINTHVTYLLFKTGCFCLDTSKKGGFSDFWTINSGGLGCVLYLNYLELQWLWDLMSCWVWCAVVSKKAQMVCRVVAIKLDEFCCPPEIQIQDGKDSTMGFLSNQLWKPMFHLFYVVRESIIQDSRSKVVKY